MEGTPLTVVLVPVQAATQVVIDDADSRWTYAGLLGCGAMVADPQLNQGDHVTDSNRVSKLILSSRFKHCHAH